MLNVYSELEGIREESVMSFIQGSLLPGVCLEWLRKPRKTTAGIAVVLSEIRTQLHFR